MSRSFSALRTSSILLACAAVSVPPIAQAAAVKGTIDPPPATAAPSKTLGYTRTLVAQRAAGASKRSDVAVFLAAKESGVTPAQTQPFEVAIANLEFEPTIAVCVIDGKVAFKNEDRAPVTVIVEDKEIGTLAPGESVTYDCKTADPQLRKMRVKEWPHIRGSLFTGEIGIVSALGANGSFSMSVPPGKYELNVVGDTGPILKKAVEVQKSDVELGRVGLPLAEGQQKQEEPAPVVQQVVTKPKPKPAVKQQQQQQPAAPAKDAELEFGEQ